MFRPSFRHLPFRSTSGRQNNAISGCAEISGAIHSPWNAIYERFMTRAEFIRDLRDAVPHVWKLKSLSPWQRLQLILLKFFSIIAYYYGKFLSLCYDPGVPGQHRRLGREDPDSDSRNIDGTARLSGTACPAREPGRDMCGRHPASRSVAVVVPAYIRNAKEGRALRSLVQNLVEIQSIKPGMVVLVDDRSPYADVHDLAGGLCCSSGSLASDGSTELVTLRLPRNCGPAAARNAGLQAALDRGATTICLTDADCYPSPAWIGEMLAAQQATPGIVCGRTVADRPHAAVGRFHDVFGTLNGRKASDGSLLFGCTCNMSLSADTARRLQFDPEFHAASFEDVEFCMRARKHGHSLVCAPGALVQHGYDYGWAGLWRQFSRYGRHEGLMCSKHHEYLDWLHASSDIPC